MATAVEIEVWMQDLDAWAQMMERSVANAAAVNEVLGELDPVGSLALQDRNRRRSEYAAALAGRLRAEAAGWAQLLLERPHWLPPIP